jgi:hypothetical protein
VQDAREHAMLALKIETSATESVVGASIGNIRRNLMTVFGFEMNLEINRVDRIPMKILRQCAVRSRVEFPDEERPG